MKDYSFVEVAKAKERMCNTHNTICNGCDLLNFFPDGDCEEMCLKFPEQAQEIIMQWAKEHPAKTNADKFKEVFGYNIDPSICGKLEDCNGRCGECELDSFWQQEYKEQGNDKDRWLLHRGIPKTKQSSDNLAADRKDND